MTSLREKLPLVLKTIAIMYNVCLMVALNSLGIKELLSLSLVLVCCDGLGIIIKGKSKDMPDEDDDDGIDLPLHHYNNVFDAEKELVQKRQKKTSMQYGRFESHSTDQSDLCIRGSQPSSEVSASYIVEDNSQLCSEGEPSIEVSSTISAGESPRRAGSPEVPMPNRVPNVSAVVEMSRVGSHSEKTSLYEIESNHQVNDYKKDIDQAQVAVEEEECRYPIEEDQRDDFFGDTVQDPIIPMKKGETFSTLTEKDKYVQVEQSRMKHDGFQQAYSENHGFVSNEKAWQYEDPANETILVHPVHLDNIVVEKSLQTRDYELINQDLEPEISKQHVKLPNKGWPDESLFDTVQPEDRMPEMRSVEVIPRDTSEELRDEAEGVENEREPVIEAEDEKREEVGTELQRLANEMGSLIDQIDALEGIGSDQGAIDEGQDSPSIVVTQPIVENLQQGEAQSRQAQKLKENLQEDPEQIARLEFKTEEVPDKTSPEESMWLELYHTIFTSETEENLKSKSPDVSDKQELSNSNTQKSLTKEAEKSSDKNSTSSDQEPGCRQEEKLFEEANEPLLGVMERPLEVELPQSDCFHDTFEYEVPSVSVDGILCEDLTDIAGKIEGKKKTESGDNDAAQHMDISKELLSGNVNTKKVTKDLKEMARAGSESTKDIITVCHTLDACQTLAPRKTLVNAPEPASTDEKCSSSQETPSPRSSIDRISSDAHESGNKGCTTIPPKRNMGSARTKSNQIRHTTAKTSRHATHQIQPRLKSSSPLKGSSSLTGRQIQKSSRNRARTARPKTSASSEISFLQRSPFRDEGHSVVCDNPFIVKLHKTRGYCQLCVFRLSDTDKAAFKKNGRHLLVKVAYGGCRGCQAFQCEEGDEHVRLCRKCFFDTHKIRRREEAFGGTCAS